MLLWLGVHLNPIFPISHVVTMTEFLVIWCAIASGRPFTLWMTDKPHTLGSYGAARSMVAVWQLFSWKTGWQLDKLITGQDASQLKHVPLENMGGTDMGVYGGSLVICAYRSCYEICMYDIVSCYLPLNFLSSKIYDWYESIIHLQLRYPLVDEWIITLLSM